MKINFIRFCFELKVVFALTGGGLASTFVNFKALAICDGVEMV